MSLRHERPGLKQRRDTVRLEDESSTLDEKEKVRGLVGLSGQVIISDGVRVGRRCESEETEESEGEIGWQKMSRG